MVQLVQLGVVVGTLHGITAALAPCLTGLRAAALSSTEVRVSWDYSCSVDKLEQVKVHYTHDGFLACPGGGRTDDSRPAGIGTTKVFGSNFTDDVLLSSLHPFSRYHIQTVELRVDGPGAAHQDTQVVTGEGAPRAVATPRGGLAGARAASPSSLHWDWGPPKPSLCAQYGAQLDHYYWRLRSLDTSGPERTGTTPLAQTSLEVSGLEPDSSYQLTVHLANRRGEWEEPGLRLLPQTTLPRPEAPEAGGRSMWPGLVAAICCGLMLLLLLLLLLALLLRRRARPPAPGPPVGEALLPQMQRVAAGDPQEEGSPLYQEIVYTVLPLARLASIESLASVESIDEDGYLRSNDHRTSGRGQAAPGHPL